MKKILLIFSIILTFTTYSLAAGSGGGNGSDNSSKKQSNAIKYKYAEKNLNKAKKYEKKNKLEKAEKHYKKAIEYLLEENKINPANPDTFNYLGFAHRKIGDYILKQKNIENYNKAGKIYVSLFGKIIETLLSISDFIKLLFVREINHDNRVNHNILEEEINLNERV